MPLPNQSWTHNLCSCDSIEACCGATWCSPCIYGRSSWRLANFPASPDQSGFSWVNESCLLMTGAWLLALPWVPIWMQRRDVRSRFGIEGGCCTDCLAACCCGCCSQVQIENELKDRAETDVLLQPQQPLSGPQTMLYAPQYQAPPSTALPQPPYEPVPAPAYHKS